MKNKKIEFDTMQEMTKYMLKHDPFTGCLIGCIITLLELIAIGVL